MMNSVRGFWSIVSLLILLAMISLPEDAAADELAIPAPLQPWTDWIMHDHPELACPQIDESRWCEWPGTLSVEADERGASFVMEVWTARRQTVALPGDDELWPQQVEVNGRPVVVGQLQGRPVVQLDSGVHRITGSFQWSSTPQYLQAPAEVGVVSLNLADEAISRPRHDESGRLWLNARDQTEDLDESDRVRASVYRRIHDGSPMQVTTRIEVNVSGRAREIDMGEVLLPDSRPISVTSPMPVEVDGESVSIYVRPGTHQILLESLIPREVEALAVPQASVDFYDPQEVWIWIPNDSVRAVDVGGLSPVDPGRTSLPQDWHGHTTFLAEPGMALELDVTRRGISASPNTLNLRRSIWLDVDGDGMTFRDTLTGTVQQGWRLDYRGPADLGRVSLGRRGEDLLITENPETGRPGVEVRSSDLNAVGDLRWDSARTTMPAVGWDHDMQSLSTKVHLPPGWTLLGASGVDAVSGSGTLTEWTLWDFFFLLMVALAVGKLLGWRWAPVAVVALLLSHGQVGAPAWTWIHLIASLALLRALPDGWWRRAVHVYRVVVLLVLFVLLSTFAHDQIHEAVHPQVEMRPISSVYSDYGDMLYAEDYEEVSAISVGSRSAPRQRSEYDVQQEQKQVRKLSQIDPNAVVQTGPGMPGWSWNEWDLQWSGPVHRDHEIRLWLVSPTMNRLLTLLRIVLLLVLALVLLSPRDMAWRKREKDDPPPRSSAWRHLIQRTGLVAVALLAILPVAQAEAQPSESAQQRGEPSLNVPSGASTVPGQDLFETLRARLVAAQTCEGPCLTVSRADFAVEGHELTLHAEVHAQMDTGWFLPGPSEALQIDEVRLNGQPTTALRREAGGLTALRVPAGLHQVEVVGRLPSRNTVTLQFGAGARPKVVSFDSQEWSIEGLSAAGIPDSSLELVRTEGVGPDAEAIDAARELPPWYTVHRTFALGLPWQVQTRITRQSSERSQLMRLPLMEGESVITDGLRVEGGEILVDFARGVEEVEILSEIPISDEVHLQAPQNQPWSEVWRVECSRIWRCEFSALPPMSFVMGGTYQPLWRPWPGEDLVVSVSRPVGVEGQSSTVDRVVYTINPGQRLLQASLEIEIRASQGGTQTITLPADAEVQSTRVGDREMSLRVEDGEIDLPIRPGVTKYRIEWQQPWAPTFVEQMPEVDIGSEAVNVDLFIQRGEKRWLLYASGPPWGPAILFWPHLLILLLIAFLLSGLRGLPLKVHEWILLVIGMSQLPYIALIPVVGWFALLTLRAKSPAKRWWTFNFLQLVIVGLTMVTAITIYAAIHINLLVDVDMQVKGTQSGNHLLHWIVDRSDGQIGGASVVSLPILIWRIIMLCWALWLVSKLLTWVPWGWKSFSTEGLWKRGKKKKQNKKVTIGAAEPAGADGELEGVEQQEESPKREAPPQPDPESADPESAEPESAEPESAEESPAAQEEDKPDQQPGDDPPEKSD